MQPEKSIDQRIRDAFEAVGGGMTTAAFARHCIETGVWTNEEIDAFTLRSAQSAVRRALNAPDVFGLPFAGRTVDTDEKTHAPVWRQRVLWEYEDYVVNIGELVGQRDVLYREALRLREECMSKFGKAPVVPFCEAGELDESA